MVPVENRNGCLSVFCNNSVFFFFRHFSYKLCVFRFQRLRASITPSVVVIDSKEAAAVELISDEKKPYEAPPPVYSSAA